jgi:hypothetical protein
MDLCQSEHWDLVLDVCYGSYVYEMHSRFSESRFFDVMFPPTRWPVVTVVSVLGTGIALGIVTTLSLVVSICTVRFNNKEVHFARPLYMCCIIPTINTHYLPIQHSSISLCNGSTLCTL